MNKVILHSNGCPRCKVLEFQLQDHHIDFNKQTDLSEVMQRGYLSVPILQVGEQFLDFNQALQWIGGNR